MNVKHPYLVQPLDGFSPRIGELVVMMSYARHTTLWAVKDLSQAQLDFHPQDDGNSIGMLLEHIAAIEVGYGVGTFENRDDLTEAELVRWEPGLELGELGREHIKGHDLEHYLNELATVRERTLTEFAKRDDSWLYEQTPFWNDEPANNYFKWFHVFEDEINHRGQIRLIRKMLKQQSS